MTAPAAPDGRAFLLGTLRSVRSLLVPSAALAMAAAACELLPYWLVYRLAAEASSGAPDGRTLAVFAGLTLAAAILRLLFLGAANVLSHRAAFGLQARLRVALVRALHRQSPAAVEGRVGELKKTLVDDVGGLEHLVAHTLPDAVAGLAVPLLAGALLLAVDWRMALASLALLPVAILAQARAFRGLGRIQARWHAAEEATNAALLAYVRGIATLKAYNRVASTFATLRGAVHALAAIADETTRRTAIPYAAFFVTLSTNLLVVLPAGVALHALGLLDTAALVLFAMLGAGLTAPLLRVAQAFAAVQRQVQGAGRVAATLAAPALPLPAACREPAGADIRFDHVDFAYGDGPAVLRDLTLTIPAGQVTALVGPSGAGKSTLARLVMRLHDVQAGAVRIGGVDVREIAPDRLRALVAPVFQDPYLFHGTIRENLAIAAPGAPEAEMVRAAEAAGLSGLIARLPSGLDTPIGDRGARLSGGERQQVAIARALLKSAPILLLDEATAFADPGNELAVQQALARIVRDRTVLVIAHRLATVADADRIAVLADGRLDAVGRHDALVHGSAVYRRLWTAHASAQDWALRR
jgi:ATP-binding cassette subfamily B protein